MAGNTEPVAHAIRSHAHEEIPGTVDMKAEAGDDIAYGLARYPVPSQDPNDPLLWPNWQKRTTLFLVSAYSFFANSALLGPSVYVNYLAELYQRTPNETSRLVTYPNLLFGLGSIVFVPMYHRLGRRPVMLISLLCYIAGLIGCALSTSYNSLLAFRIIHAFGSSVCEALPAQVVSDVFFLHERGSALGWYTFALATGSLGALVASYMLAAGLSYGLFFWVQFAAAALLFIGTFFFFEETMFFRDTTIEVSSSSQATASDDPSEPKETGYDEFVENPSISADISLRTRKTWVQRLRIVDKVDHDSPIIMMVVRSFTYFAVPPVFWVCTTYGMVIGLAALGFTSTFPVIVAAPPYNWPIENTGLVSVGAFVGYLAAAWPFSHLPDKYAAYLTRRNNGIREAEFRLYCLAIVFFVSPASLILYGYAAERQLHWSALVVATGLFQFGAFFGMTYTLAYALDSYESKVPEMLIAMNIGKQSISFGFGFSVLDWIMEHGYITMFAGIFCAILTINNLAVFGFIAFGKPMRRWFSKTWLAELHRNSIGTDRNTSL
ncbi:major facilitator superfamily domain-containing protein [Hypoxylon fuscum]|nr:major facilitator superfamily domain-containing protein [Hypoxylon fuscum]